MSLRTTDPEIARAIAAEVERQQTGIELIASENFTSPSVLEAMGTVLTNKYAEGYPGKRYYGGCEAVDVVEQIAIDRAKRLFGADHANVQPHCGSSANLAAYFAVLEPGDTILGLELSHGGHLTHGDPVNFSGKLFRFVRYGVRPETGRIDMDEVRALAREHRPKMIQTGASAYSRTFDFEAFGQIAREVGAVHFSDIAHIAGLVAAGVHPTPVGHAELITTTTHKTLRGPRGGMVLCSSGLAPRVDKAVFPFSQGGPLEHVIAAKAVAFEEALRPGFKQYAERILQNARALCDALLERGFEVVSRGTDNHLFVLDFSGSELTGLKAQKTLDRAGITTSKSTVPGEKRTPWVTSGLRIGTPAVTTREMGVAEMKQIGSWIADVLERPDDDARIAQIREQVRELVQRFPLPYQPPPEVRRPLRCPFCGHPDTKVIDARNQRDEPVKRRRRECSECGRRYTTYERIEDLLPVVVKRDGRREPFDRTKLVLGLQKACEKRPVSADAIEDTVARIERHILDLGQREVRSTLIGDEVRAELRALDPVAWLRFTSVYLNFQTIEEFRRALDELEPG